MADAGLLQAVDAAGFEDDRDARYCRVVEGRPKCVTGAFPFGGTPDE
jgi:hypothetical protein